MSSFQNISPLPSMSKTTIKFAQKTPRWVLRVQNRQGLHDRGMAPPKGLLNLVVQSQ